MQRVIESAGHVVTQVPSAQAAVQLVAGGAEFDLLVTDVRMPAMTGPELAVHLERLLPGLRTLFVSGWPGAPGPATVPPSRLLGKPFTADALLAAVAEALAG